MKKNRFVITSVILLFVSVTCFFSCKKESIIYERRALNVSIPDGYVMEGLTITSDTIGVYIEYTKTFSKDFIPFEVELKSNENITEVCGSVEFSENRLAVLLEGLNPQYNSPFNTDQMITCFYIGDIEYEIWVTYIFSEEEKNSDN